MMDEKRVMTEGGIQTENLPCADTVGLTEETASAPAKPDGKFRRFWKEYGFLIAAFLLPALLMWVIYIAMNVYPFGENSVLVLDLNGQYVYFFEALRNVIRNGGSLLYSFSRGLGGEFLGIFAYYIASPFSFLTALFPDGHITEALLVMFLLKCGSCGLTFGYYLRKTRPNASKLTIILFSMMYALSAYAVVQQHNTMWIDCVIFLPLVTLGIENIIKYGKYKMFVLFLALSIISNFYIGYMVCLYVAIYFFYYWFAHATDGENNPTGEPRHFLRTFIRMGVYALLGLAIAAAIILTAYYSLTFGKTTFTNPNYAITQNYDFLDLVTKLFPGSYDTVRPEGMPFLYCGVLTVLLIPVYFLCPKFSARERVASAVVLGIFLLCMNIYVLDIFWHGLQAPNWLNCRYSFMVCFLLLVLAEKTYEHINSIPFYLVFGSGVVFTVLLFVIQKQKYASMPDLTAIWFSLLLIFLLLIALRCARIPGNTEKHASMVLLVIVSLELFASGLLNVTALDKDVHFSSRTSYVDFMERWSPAFEKLKSYDMSFYRSEKTGHRKTNDSMTLDFNGLSNSTSTLNASTIKFLAKMGLASKSHWSKYLGGTPVEDSLLGLKYIVSDTEQSPLYEEAFTTETDEDDSDIKVYRNPYALSLATASSAQITTVNQDDYMNPFDFMNAYVTKMLGRKGEVKLFVPVKKAGPEEQNVTHGFVAEHEKYSPDGTSGDSSLTYTFDVPDVDAQLYFYYPTTYPREVNLRVNGIGSGTYFGNETHRIVNIGSRGQYSGERIEIQMVMTTDVLYLASKTSDYLYYLDEEVFKEAMTELGRYNYHIDDDYSEDHFTGTIETTKERPVIQTSIPYDKGWIVRLDGEEVETYETLQALLAFNAETPGKHTLELIYRPKAYVIGHIISFIGLGVFLLFWVIDNLKRMKARARKDAESVLVIEADEGRVARNFFPFPLVTPKKKSDEGAEPSPGPDPAPDSAPDSALDPVPDSAPSSAEDEAEGATMPAPSSENVSPEEAEAGRTADGSDANTAPDAAEEEP